MAGKSSSIQRSRRPRMTFWRQSIPVFCATALLLPVITVMADSPADARRLVEQLGSERFSDRAAATRELQRMGREVVPQLIEGVRNSDAETRRRSLFVLRELASSENVADADAVFAALTMLASQ